MRRYQRDNDGWRGEKACQNKSQKLFWQALTTRQDRSCRAIRHEGQARRTAGRTGTKHGKDRREGQEKRREGQARRIGAKDRGMKRSTSLPVISQQMDQDWMYIDRFPVLHRTHHSCTDLLTIDRSHQSQHARLLSHSRYTRRRACRPWSCTRHSMRQCHRGHCRRVQGSQLSGLLQWRRIDSLHL